jgi:predicted DNA-binding helix-hairpin-helix protein
VNVEAPSEEYLRKLSPNKELTEGILRPMRWVKYLVEREPKLVPAGQTTQFVVGAAGETDYQIFSAVRRLYDQMHLHRVYFSAFQPIAGTPLEGRSPTSRLRQQHLYQLDWLYRAYHLAPHELELAFSENGNLPINLDPKVAIALRQRRIILWT